MDKIPHIWFLKRRVSKLTRCKISKVDLQAWPIVSSRLDHDFPRGHEGIIDVYVEMEAKRKGKVLFAASVCLSAENIYRQYDSSPYWRLDGRQLRAELDLTLTQFRSTDCAKRLRGEDE